MRTGHKLPRPQRHAWRRATVASAVLLPLLLLAPSAAVAQTSAYEQAQNTYVLTPLTRVLPHNEPDVVRFVVTGLVNLRGQLERSFPLPVTLSARAANPRLVGSSIQQNAFGAPWIRFTPQFDWGRRVRIVAQLDLAQGKVMGNPIRDVGTDPQPRDNAGSAGSFVMPRWLYGELLTSVGLFRVGMQPNHWGMGILANDGDHAQLFGVPRLGQISERILFATKPLGENGPLTTAIAADYVYRDNFARLSRGDHAVQGVLATYIDSGPNRLGFFGVYRTQKTDRESTGATYTDDLRVFAFDLAGHTMAMLPGMRDAFAFAEAEGALQLGSSSALRSGALPAQRASVRAFGGAARVGFVFGGAARARAAAENSAASPTRYGKLVAQLEWGYASGDADPNDGVQKRFTFDPNHRVGLLLFDEVLRWSSARAAVIARDPLLANQNRPQPGLDYLPTGGAVAGAQYLNPTFVFRPEPDFDVRAGIVVAQATSDVVSQVRATTHGRYENEFGGDPKRRDLGVELDLGVHKRIAMGGDVTALFGAEGGLLFPGGALADATGVTMKMPWIGVVSGGLTF